MDSVTVDGAIMDRVYINDTLVYENSVTLQLPSSGQAINLKDFIDANAEGKEKVLLESNGILGGIESGDLSGLDVTLTINGESQGLRSDTKGVGGDALKITSPMKLYLNGALRGAGGGGGTGAKGADDTYTTTEDYDSRFNSSNKYTYHNNGKAIVYWNGSGKTQTMENSEATVYMNGVGGVDYAWRTGGLKNTTADGILEYAVWAREKISVDRTGGEGGLGGLGRGYDKALTSGSTGSPSTPSGGNTGGTGGSGGDWGDAGVRPIGGSAGALAGNAISGQSFIQNNDWNNGQVDGLVT